MRIIIAVFNAILGIILALTPFFLAPVCTALRMDGGRMSCWYSGLFIVAMGIIVILSSIFTIKKPCLFFFSFAAALMAWLVPNRIIELSGDGWSTGLCGAADHACRASTMPLTGLLVIAIIIISVIGLITGFVGLGSKKSSRYSR